LNAEFRVSKPSEPTRRPSQLTSATGAKPDAAYFSAPTDKVSEKNITTKQNISLA